MEQFIRDYVEGYLDCLGVDAEKHKDKIEKVIKFVCADDHWCDVLDNTILESCDRFGVPIKED